MAYTCLGVLLPTVSSAEVRERLNFFGEVLSIAALSIGTRVCWLLIDCIELRFPLCHSSSLCSQPDLNEFLRLWFGLR